MGRIAQLDGHGGIFQQDAVHVDALSGQVDASRQCGGQHADAPLQVGVGNEVEGVEAGVEYVNTVNLGAAVHQRPQLDAYAQGTGVEQGVAPRDGLHVAQREVEREGQPYVADADVHSRRFGQDGRGAVHGKALYRRQVYQYGQYEKQHDRHGHHEGQPDGYVPDSLSFIHIYVQR